MSKRPSDINQLAKFIVDQATGNVQPEVPDVSDDERKAAARILGRMGGLRGGPARSAALSKAKRSEIAKKAAQARWKKPAKKKTVKKP